LARDSNHPDFTRLEDMPNQVRQDLGIHLGPELVILLKQLVLEKLEILDYTVVDEDKFT
jgi:hypothetical protein